MIAFTVLERLLWAGIGGGLAIGAALLACRLPRLHPSVKVWACRLTMLKLVVSPLLAVGVPVVTEGGETPFWATAELGGVLLGAWMMGAAVVLAHAGRAYGAARALKRGSVRIALQEVPSGIEVRRAEGLREPCVIGLIRPILLVPKGESPEPGVIQHELAHVRHGDVAFGGVAWVAQAVAWFVPGCGRLASEHSLWQEAWADLEARVRLGLPPSEQANDLLGAAERFRSMSVAALGYRGDTFLLARRIEAMFVRRHSAALAVVIGSLMVVLAIPVRPAAVSRVGAVSPVATRVRPSVVPVAGPVFSAAAPVSSGPFVGRIAR